MAVTSTSLEVTRDVIRDWLVHLTQSLANGFGHERFHPWAKVPAFEFEAKTSTSGPNHKKPESILSILDSHTRDLLHPEPTKVVRDPLARLKNSTEPIMLLGEGGSGKTTLLRRLGIMLADRELRNRLPRAVVYARLGSFGDVDGDFSVLGFIERTIPSYGTALRRQISSLASEGRLIILFDGMDEMGAQNYMSKVAALNKFALEHSGYIKMVFSCRTSDFTPTFGHRLLVLLPLDAAAISEYVEAVFPASVQLDGWVISKRQLRQRLKQNLEDVDGNPFLLSLFCEHIRHHRRWPIGGRDLVAYSMRQISHRGQINDANADDNDQLDTHFADRLRARWAAPTDSRNLSILDGSNNSGNLDSFQPSFLVERATPTIFLLVGLVLVFCIGFVGPYSLYQRPLLAAWLMAAGVCFCVVFVSLRRRLIVGKLGGLDKARDAPTQGRYALERAIPKEQQLSRALVEFAKPEELRQLLQTSLVDNEQGPTLSIESSADALAAEVVDQLRRRGLIDKGFFRRLTELHPDATTQIEKLQRTWLATPARTTDTSHIPVLPQSSGASGSHVLVLYAHDDEVFADELRAHLSLLWRKKSIDAWTDVDIDASLSPSDSLGVKFERASVIVLLLSPEFVTSVFCRSADFDTLLRRHRDGSALVLPVLTRDCDLTTGPLAQLYTEAHEGHAIAKQQDVDLAWMAIARSIAIRKLSSQTAQL